MIQPNLQLTLFTSSKEEALKLANTSESIASQWFNQNYLSFDITLIKELENSQVLELEFLSQLFNSTLSLDTINKLLVKLSKPYAYNYYQIYFDIFSNDWKYLPEKVDEEEVAKEYLENLSAEEDREEIEDLIRILQELLNDSNG